MIGDRRIVFATTPTTVEPLRVSPPEAVAYLFELGEHLTRAQHTLRDVRGERR